MAVISPVCLAGAVHGDCNFTGRCVWQVLVHGEQNEMARLKAALIREYEDDAEYNIEVYNPRNTQAVELQFRGEKMAKVRSLPPLYTFPVSSCYSCQTAV